MPCTVYYVIERYKRSETDPDEYWDGKRWRKDLKSAKGFLTRETAEIHARREINERLWSVVSINHYKGN